MNTHNTHHKKLAAIIISLFAFAPLAHAAVDVGGAVKVDMESKLPAGIKAGEVELVTPVQIEMKGESEVRTTDEKIEMKAGEERGLDRAQMVANEHALDVLADVELRIDLRKSEKEERASGTAEVDSAAKVQTEKDFESFVRHKAESDMHLKGVEVKDGKVEVKYDQPAKFFGFIKTDLKARASVDAQDNVVVKYPWYHIFMKKHVSKASMQSNIARAIAAERKAVKEGMATTTIQAEITAAMGIPNLFEIIANELQSARVKAEAEASGTATVE